MSPQPSSEQLSLLLDEQPLGLSADLIETLRPMLARPVREPFDAPDYLFEPRWGGLRILAFIETKAVWLIDRRGRDLTAAFPELAELAGQVADLPAIVDGEIVMADAKGCADGAALDRRLAGAPGPSVSFLASDLLLRGGRLVLSTPLERRRADLRRVLKAGGPVLIVPAVAADGVALHHAVVDQGLDGTIGRHRRSPYLPGVRSALWQFVERLAPLDPATPASIPSHADAVPESGLGGSRPILSVLSRLPLGDEPPGWDAPGRGSPPPGAVDRG